MSDTKNNGGPAFQIYCTVCGSSDAIARGTRRLCEKHYRYEQMRYTAKKHGKRVPYMEELAAMHNDNLDCPDCGVQMNWLSANGKATVASLQHYRDGTMTIVCRSCNTRHAYMDGDTYRDTPKDCKVCPSCKTLKAASEFYKDASRSGPLKRTSRCKGCMRELLYEWRRNSGGKFAEYQREYRKKKKADAMLKAREQ